MRVLCAHCIDRHLLPADVPLLRYSRFRFLQSSRSLLCSLPCASYARRGGAPSPLSPRTPSRHCLIGLEVDLAALVLDLDVIAQEPVRHRKGHHAEHLHLQLAVGAEDLLQLLHVPHEHGGLLHRLETAGLARARQHRVLDAQLVLPQELPRAELHAIRVAVAADQAVALHAHVEGGLRDASDDLHLARGELHDLGRARLHEVAELASREARLLEAARGVELGLLFREVLHLGAEQLASPAGAADAGEQGELRGVEQVINRRAVHGAEVEPRSVHEQHGARVVGQDVVEVDQLVQGVPGVANLREGILGGLRALDAVHDLLGRVPGAQEATALHVAADLLGGGVHPREGRVHDLEEGETLHLPGPAAHREQLQLDPADLLEEVLHALRGGSPLGQGHAVVRLRDRRQRGPALGPRPLALLCVELQVGGDARGEDLVHGEAELAVVVEQFAQLLGVPGDAGDADLGHQGERLDVRVAQVGGRADQGARDSGGLGAGLRVALHHHHQPVIRLVQGLAGIGDRPAAALQGEHAAELDLGDTLVAEDHRVEQRLVHGHLLELHLVHALGHVHDAERQERQERGSLARVGAGNGLRSVQAVAGVLRRDGHADGGDGQLKCIRPVLRDLAHLLEHEAKRVLARGRRLRHLAHPGHDGVHAVEGVPPLRLLPGGLEGVADLLPDGVVVRLERRDAGGRDETVEHLHAVLGELQAEDLRRRLQLLDGELTIAVQVKVLERGTHDHAQLRGGQVLGLDLRQHDAEVAEAAHEGLAVDVRLGARTRGHGLIVLLQECHEALHVAELQAKLVLLGQLQGGLGHGVQADAAHALRQGVEQARELAARRRAAAPRGVHVRAQGQHHVPAPRGRVHGAGRRRRRHLLQQLIPFLPYLLASAARSGSVSSALAHADHDAGALASLHSPRRATGRHHCARPGHRDAAEQDLLNAKAGGHDTDRVLLGTPAPPGNHPNVGVAKLMASACAVEGCRGGNAC
mmetsp:Transcript_67205/g.145013  ORF Transcript_67205/g.145013 Transcript_67205/m.145013 type:complete len:983 (+) Transcript_67205:1151-4099(+)